MPGSSIEAVVEALQRQQSEAVGGESLRAEQIMEAMRRSLQGSLTQRARIEIPRQPIGANDSLIKARYALTVLRVAQATDWETAARLVRGLAHDFPHPNELPEIADIHLRAIDLFSQLATSLGDARNVKPRPWNSALDAASDWLRAVEVSNDPPIRKG
jgi:hypothetical protein